ncbi:MAG: hypothetical protein H6905_06285 [Hyphomicrobiales bacterium]|nr:hypothetical protein [Hyphomicrobiales bacterium]
MIAKCLNKIFALDGHSTSVEYSIIAVLLLSAFLSTALAIDGLWGDIYSALFEPNITASS